MERNIKLIIYFFNNLNIKISRHGFFLLKKKNSCTVVLKTAKHVYPYKLLPQAYLTGDRVNKNSHQFSTEIPFQSYQAFFLFFFLLASGNVWKHCCSCVFKKKIIFIFLLKFNMVCMFWIVLMC